MRSRVIVGDKPTATKTPSVTPMVSKTKKQNAPKPAETSSLSAATEMEKE